MKFFIATFFAIVAVSSASLFHSNKKALTEKDVVVTTGNLFQTTRLVTVISPENLKKGSNVDENTAMLVQAMGIPEDTIGYIVPQQAGGPGELWNLYPRVVHPNNVKQVNEMEKKLVELVKKDGMAEVEVEMNYFLSPKTTRPTFVKYKITSPNNHYEAEIDNVGFDN